MLMAAVILGTAACSPDNTASPTTNIEPALVPDATAVAPGGCDPTQTLDAPAITTGGETTPATLGIGDFSCGGVNGAGYISFNYNPVLIEGDGSIEVTIGDGVTAVLAWTGTEPFTESDPGVWSSSLSDASCNRLTIELASEFASASATYGADIRVGGDDVLCPQRTIDPSEPPDGTLVPTAPTTAAP